LLYSRRTKPIDNPWTIYNWFIKISYSPFRIKADKKSEDSLVKLINILTVAGFTLGGLSVIMALILLWM
ncbi:MAG: hypothetical protein QMB03_07070, partial [Spirosomataceae bacterium]